MKNKIFLICTIISFSLGAREPRFSDYVTTSPIYLLDAMTERRSSCVNKLLREAEIQERNVLIEDMPNVITSSDGGELRKVYVGILGSMFEETGINVINIKYMAQGTFHFVIEGQLTSKERSFNKSRSAGIFARYFSAGLNRSSYQNILQMDFNLYDGGGFFITSSQVASSLQSLDRAVDGEGDRKRKGIYLEWGNEYGNSEMLSVRILIEEAAFKFASYISGVNLSSCKKLNLRPVVDASYVNNDIEEVTVYSKYRKKKKKYYFPSRYKNTFRCKSLDKCHFGFRGDNHSSALLQYAEEALLASFYKDSTVNVECKPYRRDKIKCTASGDLWAFSGKKFRRNLYSG